MIMEYLGMVVPQCSQANDEFHRTDCCTVPTPGSCDSGGWPQFDKHGFTFLTTNNAALAWPAVEAQLAPHDPNNPCSFTPFAFTWHWRGGGGHMMVVTGYEVDNGVDYVLVNDPLEVNVGSTKSRSWKFGFTLNELAGSSVGA